MIEEKTDILSPWSKEGNGGIVVEMNPSFPV
jgi:hypothetical protein